MTAMTARFVYISTIGVILVAIGSVASAEITATAESVDPVVALGDLFTAVKGGDWRIGIAAALSLVMFAGRYKNKIPFIRTDRGGAIAALVLSLAGAFSTALATGEPMTISLAVDAVSVAFTAVGGYTFFKRVIAPPDKKHDKARTDV